MKNLLSASLFVLAPLLAAVVPYIYHRMGLAQRIRVRGLAHLNRNGFHAMSRNRDNRGGDLLWWKLGVQGATMIVCVMTSMAIFVSRSGSQGNLWVVLGGSVTGVLAAAGLLTLVTTLNAGIAAMRPAQLLEGLGLRGAWHAEQSMPFRAELLKSIKEYQTLYVVGSDAVELLASLSHNAHPELTAPHPNLRNTRIRLLVVPPRSQRADAEQPHRTVSAVALEQLGRSVEEHWRRLSTVFEVKERWAGEFGLDLDVLFLENRPSFHIIASGDRIWFRPWQESSCWLEARVKDGKHQLYGALRNELAQGLSTATHEMATTLVAGPTKSTFIRNGVEVAIPRESTSLTIEDCTLQT